MSTKKIKFENDFNIIRELYLNKENRNLLNEFLKYLNIIELSYLSISISGETGICNNCFKYVSVYYQPDCIDYRGFYLCHECRSEHHDKYSKYSHSNLFSNNNICVVFSHECYLSDKKSTAVVKMSIYKFIENFTNVEKINSSPSSLFYN